MDSWQIYYIAKKKLPPGILHNIYSRQVKSLTRLIDYWSSNPRVSKSKRNPIDRIRILLEELDIAGYGEYARWAIDYMAEPLGGRFTDTETAKSDKGSIDSEAADITVSLGELINLLRDAGSDGNNDTAKIIRIKSKARTLRIQIEKLLDAAGIKEG